MGYFIVFFCSLFLVSGSLAQDENKLIDRLPDNLSNYYKLQVDTLFVGCNGLKKIILPDFQLSIYDENKPFNTILWS